MANVYIQVDSKSCDVGATAIPELVLEQGTNFPASGYAFDDTTREDIYKQLQAANYASGNITVKFRWYSRTGQTTGTVEWGARVAAITPGDAQSVLTKSFATTQVTSATVGGTARLVNTTTVKITNLDSIAIDDEFWINLYRNPSGTDTMTGDAVLIDVQVSYLSV